MATATFSKEYLDAHRTILSNPAAYGFSELRPIKDCFEPAEKVTAKHILAEQYRDYIDRPVAKLIVYVLMDELFGQCIEKDEKGDLGYKLKFTAVKT